MEKTEKIANDEFVEEVTNQAEAETAELEPALAEPVVEVSVSPKREKIEKLLTKKDIKYRGPFSYRTFRAIGFMFMLFAQAYFIYSIVGKLVPMKDWAVQFLEVLEILSVFALPMFLTANFCIIMSSKRKIKNFLILYATIALLIYAVILLVYYRYLAGITTALTGDPVSGLELAEMIAKQFFGKWLNYNIFVDLTLFSLFFFFFFYTPKNIKSKKGLTAFRWCSLIPVLIVVGTTLLYGFYLLGYLKLPVAALAIMPCRSITAYAIFFVLAFVVKFRHKIFKKWGGTEEDYEHYLKTKRNSLEMAVLASIVVFVVCLIDFVLLCIEPYVIFFGFGINFYIAFVIPFIFLLAYNRQPRFKNLDILLPFIFIGCVVIVYLEAVLYLFTA